MRKRGLRWWHYVHYIVSPDSPFKKALVFMR